MARWMLRAFGVLLIATIGALAFAQDNDPVEIVVAPNETHQTLSLNVVRAIFGMRLRTWPDGKAIRVFVLKDDHQTHILFCKRIINIFPHQLRLAWDRLVFSGTGQAPIEVDSEKDMLASVATTPGAIGYLRRSMVNDSVDVLELQ